MHADCLPGATVTVRVNGTPLTEYATENSDMTATTFVEAVAGAQFDIALTWTDFFAYRAAADRIRFCVYVDGQWVGTPIVSTHIPRLYQNVVEGPQTTLNGMTTFSPLTFEQHASSKQHVHRLSEHQLISIAADSRADDKTMKELGDVGQIKVTLQRCRIGGRKPPANSKSDFKGVAAHGVPEKALKGRSISNHTK